MKKVIAVLVLFIGTAFAQTAKVQAKPVGKLTAVFPGTQHQVVLSWTASTTSGVTYNVWRGTSAGTETKYQTGLSVLTFTDNAVTEATTYYYYVTAQKSGAESAGSNEVNGTVPANPAPPSNLTGAYQ